MRSLNEWDAMYIAFLLMRGSVKINGGNSESISRIIFVRKVCTNRKIAHAPVKLASEQVSSDDENDRIIFVMFV